MRFLQWPLPQMHVRRAAFRKLRRQVCEHVDRRMHALGLTGVDEYQGHRDAHADEWATLDSLCRITIWRFSRCRGRVARSTPWSCGPRRPAFTTHATRRLRLSR